MLFVSLSCPQCSAPLPRVAIWRSVKCGFCGALVTRSESVVTRETFRQALHRARGESLVAGNQLECAGVAYRMVEQLGASDRSKVYLARSVGLHPFLVTVKVSSAPDAAVRYAREAAILRELSAGEAVAYAMRRLPEAVAHGPVAGAAGGYALVLRHPVGYWGSLAALNARFPDGIDPRHAVWLWRRMLGTLGFVHAQGWSHGDVRPEHALVHPADHEVRLIGWAAAARDAGAEAHGLDLARSARVVMVLLSGAGATILSRVPEGIARLVATANRDEKFCQRHGAQGLDAMLRAAALEAFGPPSFVPLLI